MVAKSRFAPRLVIIEGQEKGRVIPLKGGTAIIGRSKGDILIQDPRISRSHVALNFDAERQILSFTDLKSLNGTLVNGEQVRSAELKDGDKLQVGDTVFDCQLEPGEERSESRSERTPRPLPADDAPAPPFESEEEEAEPSLDLGRLEEPAARVEIEELESTRTRVKVRKARVSLRQRYLSLPPQKRRMVLYVALILLGLVYYVQNDSSSGGGGSVATGLDGDLEAVRRLAEKGDLASALQRIEALKSSHPDSDKVLLMLGDLQAANRNDEAAIAAYQAAHTLPTVNPIVHIKLVRVYLRSGFPQRAAEEYAHLSQEIQQTGRLLASSIEGKEATVADVIRQYPYVRELFVETAKLFLEFRDLKQPPEQVVLIARALQKDIAPDSTIGHKLEAQVLFTQNEPNRAIPILEAALKIDGRDRWLIENLALAKFRAQDFAGAEAIVKQWIAAYPDATKAYLIMSYLKFTQQDVNGAVPFLQKIIEVGSRTPNDPFYPEALYLIGQVFQQNGRTEEAANYVKQSCQLGYELACKGPSADGRAPGGESPPGAGAEEPPTTGLER